MSMRKTIAATAALGLGMVGSIGAANADPQGDTVEVTCDGVTSTYAVNGRGAWTPAHALESTGVIVPTAFASQSGTLTDSDGNVVDSYDEPGPITKGKGDTAAGREPVSCDYLVTGSFVAGRRDAPFLIPGETYTYVDTGEVTGFLTGQP